MPDRTAGARFDILREIFEIARKQHACLERDEVDAFRQLMDRRDELMARLQQMLQAPQEAPANVIAFPSPAVEHEAMQDRIAIDTLIRGILEHDARNERLLQEKMGDVRRELGPLQAGRRAATGYHTAAEGGAYIDRVS